jgi:hypothetical protein
MSMIPHVGGLAPCDRCGPNARFTSPGGDREQITFRPAQLDCLHASKGDRVLIATGHITALIPREDPHR